MNVDLSSPALADHLPPGPHRPRAVQGAEFLVGRRRALQRLARRYGDAVTLALPAFGDAVLISDPAMAKQLCMAKSDVVANVRPNLGRILGGGSMFALDADDHRRRRKLLTPPLHGKRIKAYEEIVAEEFAAESATWPIGRPFPTLEPMMRITLNVILRAVFGADGMRLDALRELMPPLVTHGSRLTTLPDLPGIGGSFNPRNRFAAERAAYDAVVVPLIREARADPQLADRADILALMVQSSYDDGSSMTDAEISDELLTLLAAGHETTATTLAWAMERLSRHPAILADLAAEADSDENTLRIATIHEVQRSRPVIDLFGRHVIADSLELGPYRIPKGYNVIVGISLLHDDSREFADPERFDPERFVGARPGQAWLPFGGGTRRCIGSAFAHMEMDVVLRELFRSFTVQPTTAKDERWHSRGVAYAPARGGRVTLSRTRPSFGATR
ncbi:cytochrome P450 [Gordonia neofelifaecis]|uniref:Cytochrome P450 n=1 Tax=Gordonia neofelifaecis NRRL B-59395 TaxID=644548 RepID=F1YFV7_9ACTN|nr:cytochrome P450 [Gordonia neofelifaecis]EGD56534.1 cytochrome P450 [Gordonia neofelifaecis NRRL B-59395]